MSIGYRSALDLAADIRTKAVSSVEALQAIVERLEAHNAAVNAVVTLDLERAFAAARRADEALARGEITGPLHGVPMTVKEAFEIAGVRTTGGYPMYADHVPETDAVAVARLKAAGAVIYGKTNVPFASADTQTYNDLFGTTNNPYDLSRSPGGSSGGSSAALAAGFTPLELGTDIGGSIRNPAHYCGVYGHKPTHGLVPLRGNIPGPPGTQGQPDLACAGPLARSAADLAAALDILAGPLPDRAVGWRLQLPPPRRTSLAQYRVAAWLDDEFCPVDSAVGDVLQDCVDALARAGATVDDKARPDVSLPEAAALFERLIAPITVQAPAEMLLAALQAGPDDPVGRLRTAAAMHKDWLRANERRERYRARWAELFQDFDVLLCPVSPVTAITHDHGDFASRTITVNGDTRPYANLMTWCGAIGNMTLLPVTVAPAGVARDGLPVGVQIVGPYLEDRTPIDVAMRMESVVAGFQPPAGY